MTKYGVIDVGGTFIKYGLLNDKGFILKSNKKPTPIEKEFFIETIFEIITEFNDQIQGIAICCPGKIDYNTGIIYYGGTLKYLHEMPLKSIIENEFQCSVSIINDGKAVVLAEYWLGNLKDIDNGCAMVLGTAVGGGILVGGNLVLGQHYQAGELSFMPVIKNNKKLSNLGNELSSVKFITEASSLISLDKPNGKIVFDEIDKGNERLIKLMEKYALNIAYYILTIQAIIDAEKIVIGGGISRQEKLIREINRQVNYLKTEIPGYMSTMTSPTIECCKFKNDANLIGALYHFISTHKDQ